MFIKIISKQNYIVRLKRFDFYFVIRDPPSKKKKKNRKRKKTQSYHVNPSTPARVSPRLSACTYIHKASRR